MKSKPESSLFGWSSEGVGLGLSTRDARIVAHEDLFDGTGVSMSESRMYVGSAIPANRFLFALGCLILSLGLLFGRAFWMQIVHEQLYQQQAEDNRLRHDILPALRGIIRDRNGTVLAENVPSFDLRVTPWLLPKNLEQREDLLGNVARQIGLNVSELEQQIASSTNPTQEMTVTRDISYDRAIAMQILLGNDPALHVVAGTKRRYPLSSTMPSLSHILGYVGTVSVEDLKRSGDMYRQTDVIGKVGVEASAEDRLRGQHGERVYEVDAINTVTGLIADRVPQDGQDVQLTIDATLQEAAEVALRTEMERAHVERGAVVVLHPQDGSLLAVVSLPAYDNNIFSGTVSSTLYQAIIADPSHPLLPRAWAGVYPSGSTIKPVIATAALAEHVITPNTSVNSVGGIRIGSSFFPDWKAGGHGATNVRRAIAWSVNTFFYMVGGGYEGFLGLGVDRLTDWMKRFGLGQKTGLDIPGESAGFVPSREWKEQVKHEHWYVGDTYNISIGQGDLLVTPLQVANFTADISNGGYHVTPHVIAHANASSTIESRQIADEEYIKTVRLGMRDGVLYGSGRALASFPLPVSGKTGTAQWRNDRANHAWFTSFAPFDHPDVVVTVLLEEGGEGSSTAVPVARDVLNAWLRLRR